MRHLLALTIFFALIGSAGAQTLDAPGSKVMVGPSSAMGTPVSASRTTVTVQVPPYYGNQGFYANGNYYNNSYYYGYGQTNYGYYNNQGYGVGPVLVTPQQPRHFRDYHSQRRRHR